MVAVLRIEVPDELLDRRAIKSEIRKQFRKMGEVWHRKHRKRHFSHFGARLYRYTPRKRGYNRWKKRRFGHTLPLVQTGVSRKLSEHKRITVSNSGTTERPQYFAQITMPVKAFNYRPRNSSVDMRREFRTLADSELKSYEGFAVPAIEQKINRQRPGKTRKIS